MSTAVLTPFCIIGKTGTFNLGGGKSDREVCKSTGAVKMHAEKTTDNLRRIKKPVMELAPHYRLIHIFLMNLLFVLIVLLPHVSYVNYSTTTLPHFVFNAGMSMATIAVADHYQH
jgi:hypothetical protein